MQPSGVLRIASELGSGHAAEETAAQTIAMPHKGSGGPSELAESIAVVLALLILGIVLCVTLFERRHLKPSTVGSLLFMSLCVLPLFLMLFGTFATVERAKGVEFCHSCHSAMNLYVADMLNPDSPTLVAVHYKNRYIEKNQCYRCHADYSIWGEIDAKARGLSHLYYWLTKSATARGEQQIHLHRSYQNTLCLQCHAGSQRFLAAGGGIHRTLAGALLEMDAKTGAPTTSCTACHRLVHPALTDAKNGRQASLPRDTP